MTRPALIIGLGGTGWEVLRLLKRELMEIGRGRVPEEVRLLSFDLPSFQPDEARQAPGAAPAVAAAEGLAEAVDGGVKLSNTEFIPVGGDLHALASNICQLPNDDRYAHLQWFPACQLLNKLPASAFNTTVGGAQIRQLGRLSLYNEMSNAAASRILKNIDDALQHINRMRADATQQLEIHFVGSLAGGSGAGVLVDFPVILRRRAEQLGIGNFIIRGFFVLPRAFGGGNPLMNARAFAAWRELDRFMVLKNDSNSSLNIKYHATNATLNMPVKTRPYDITYMVDSARNGAGGTINIDPKRGVYPTVANVISAILDVKAGWEYTTYVTVNLSARRAALPIHPFHSAVGSYTLKVPVYFAEASFSHQLVLETLKKLIAPQIVRVGTGQRVTGVSETENREVPQGQTGVRAATVFMNSAQITYTEEAVNNTQFLPLVADVKDKDGVNNAALVQQAARGGITTTNNRWLNALTVISQDAAGKAIQDGITKELHHTIWGDVAPYSVTGVPPEDAFAGIRSKVPTVIQSHYGYDTADGTPRRGTYGAALERAKAAQVARFKKLLRIETMRVLNGVSADVADARSGKIGYLRSYYAGLQETFAYFLEFIQKVRDERNNIKIVQNARQAANNALNSYDQLKGKKAWANPLNNFIHPDALQAERNYLQAEQVVINVRKDSILLDVLAETAMEMQVIAGVAQKEAESWIEHLATGNAAMKVDGLYHAALAAHGKIGANHVFDQQIDQVSGIIGDHQYPNDNVIVTNALGCFRWEVPEDVDGGGFKIVCGVDLPDANPQNPAIFMEFRRDGQTPSADNLQKVLRLTEQPFRAIYQARPFATEISTVHPNGTALANTVNNLANPLYLSTQHGRGPEVISTIVRVKSDINAATAQYFQVDFQDQMRALGVGGLIIPPDSEDSHKMTVVRSDDLIRSEDFDMWEKCRDSYISVVTDPHNPYPARELYVFPAEVNASEYETAMPLKLRQNYRTLHPSVVALLEDKQKFESFVKACSLGYIKVVDHDTLGYYWEYRLDAGDDPIFLTQPDPNIFHGNEIDMFLVMQNFVIKGCDQRPGMNNVYRVDWGRLSTAIMMKERRSDRDEIIGAYQKQTADGGLVAKITAQTEGQRARYSAIANVNMLVGQEYQDLADVVKLVLLQAIDRIKAMPRQ